MSAFRSTFRRLCCISAVLVLAATGCSDDSGGGGKASPSGSVPAQGGTGGAPLQSQALVQNASVRVDLMALDRVSDKVIVARLRLVNQGSTGFTAGSLREVLQDPKELPRSDPNSISGVSLFDGVNSQRYFPLVGTDGKCLCTSTTPPPSVAAGQSTDLVAAFPAPPASAGRLGLFFPDAPPFLDVPVTDRPGQTITVGSGQAAIDPAKAQTAQPLILPVIATVQTPTGGEDDNGTDLSVRISTDVLFALNKADLSPRAQEILKGVAAKIDQSPGKTVRIDGHADSSGNDAINIPLSKSRAQSVENALKKLVTRAGVGYAAEGHGSSQPIAPNDTPEGRQANRRVTVTFARPKPAAQTANPAPSGSAGPTLTIQSSAPKGYAGQWPKKATVKIVSLHRSANGYVTLTWHLENQDPVGIQANLLFTATPDAGYKGSSTSGATLTSGNLRYRSLRDGWGKNIGPDFDVMDPSVYQVAQGENLTLTALYKIPADVTSVSVQIPGFGQAQNVPVQ